MHLWKIPRTPELQSRNLHGSLDNPGPYEAYSWDRRGFAEDSEPLAEQKRNFLNSAEGSGALGAES